MAGILLGLSFPPVNLSFLSIPAFVLFFMLGRACSNLKQTAYYSYAGFLIWNLITTYWLMMADVTAGVAANLANSALMTIPLCLAVYFDREKYSPYLVAFLQASSWVVYEFLHHNWDLSWPWLTIANAWSNQISLIQYISVTGHLGISFWVVLTASLTALYLSRKKKHLAWSALAVFILLPALSLLQFNLKSGSEVDSDNSTEIAIIQPNHDSYQNYGGMSGLEEVVDSLFVLAERVIKPETELIIWPENAIDDVIQPAGRTARRIADSARSWNTDFILGTSLYKFYRDTTPDLYRGIYRDMPYNIYNSALYVNGDGSTGRYDKNNLVPIVERVPFVDQLASVDFFGWVNWGRLQGFGQGLEPSLISGERYATSGLVCYDSVYPGWVRDFVNNGATFITIITNDGWWGNTSGHHQHFAYARLRAIEFDRWVARSANNGISGIIAPDGSIHRKTDYWVRTGFTFNIPNRSTLTPYSRFGDWLSALCMLLLSIVWGYQILSDRFRP